MGQPVLLHLAMPKKKKKTGEGVRPLPQNISSLYTNWSKGWAGTVFKIKYEVFHRATFQKHPYIVPASVCMCAKKRLSCHTPRPACASSAGWRGGTADT